MSQFKRSQALFLFLVANLISAAPAFAAFVIEAPAGSFDNDTRVTLARHDVDQRATRQFLETKTASDGSLLVETEEEAGVFVLKIEGSGEITLAPSSGERITLSAAGEAILSSGSPGSTVLQEYERFRKESLARLVYPTRADIRSAKARGASEDEIIRLTQAEVDAYEEHIAELNDFVIEKTGTTLALYGTSLRWNGDYRGEELAKRVAAFAEVHGDIAATRSLQERIQTARRVAIGATAPNIEGENLEGVTESLEAYRGRYVLVDFWASWCPPCRLENRHYQKLTSQIPPDSFTVFAINLDTNKSVWTRAVKQDQADWIHVSDLAGWTSNLAATYGVTALPSSFLLDPDGRIVAKDLRGPALDAKLRELGVL